MKNEKHGYACMGIITMSGDIIEQFRFISGGSDDHLKFKRWLAAPIGLTMPEIMRLKGVFNIPDWIIIYKYIQGCKLTGVSPADIITQLRLAYILKPADICIIGDMYDHMSADAEQIDILKERSACGNVILNLPEKHKQHADYPLPDPVLGRPHLNFLECKYDGCGQKFANTTDLMFHLCKNNAFVPFMHKAHEDIVAASGLSPETVRAQNITKCPSLICTAKHIRTCEDLCEHFKKLGIPPFWSPTASTPTNDTTVNTTNDTNDNADIKPCAIIDAGLKPGWYKATKTMCMRCKKDPVNTISLTCAHCTMCKACCLYGTRTCPQCKVYIANVLYI